MQQRFAGRPGAADRRIWEIGDWGGASRYIGQRWESLGLSRLQGLLGRARRACRGQAASRADPFTPGAVISLALDETVQQEIVRMGLVNPDAILAGRTPTGELVLQAVDFKWTLETASYRQIAGRTLEELVTRQRGPLWDAVAAATDEVPPQEWQYWDGFFFAPATEANRRFLASPLNRRQEYPLEAAEVELVEVDPAEFFGQLPGWEMARRLVAMDRAAGQLTLLDRAERYYRLGAGVGGALERLATPLFGPSLEGFPALEKLSELIRAQRLFGSAEIVDHLGRQMRARREAEGRLNRLRSCPYRWSTFREDLAGHGVVLAERAEETAEGSARWTALYRSVADRHRAAVDAEGRQLLDRGLAEVPALGELERRRPEFATRARLLAARLIERALSAEG